MNTMPRIKGVVPVLSTPLTRTGDVDEPGLRRLVDWLVEKPIAGLWVLGTGSEDMNLGFAKRKQVAEIVCDQIRGRTPLMVGTAFMAMEDILDFAEAIAHLPFAAYHVMPYHTLLSFDRLAWFYEHIADRVGKPLWMYTSANWSKPFTPDFVARLKDHPNICGVKFSTKDTLAIQKVAAMCDEEFQLITAVASQFLACLAMGSPAHTSSLGSACPDAMIEIYDLYQAGKIEECRAAQFKLNRFLASWPAGGKSNNFLQAAEEKAILEARGICGHYTSSYYADLDDDARAELARLTEEYGYL